MGLLFSLIVAIFLAGASSVRDNHEKFKIRTKVAASLHLPLYHARGRASEEAPMSYANALEFDEARVKFLNSRITKTNITAVPISTLTGSSGLIDQSSVRVPLNPGNYLGVGNYYTRIGLGNPATYHLVVVDTGSSFSWLQCQPCAIYCHTQIGEPFNPSDSNTYQRLSCDTSACSSLKEATLNNPECTNSNTCLYTSTYGDQSFSVGYLSQDVLTFGSESLPGFVFGCGQDNDGLFGRSAGLFGLAKNKLSLISQLSKKYGNAFSYCLPTEKTGNGGFLSIGGGTSSGYRFTPMLSDSRDPTLYFIRLSAITVSGKALSVPGSEYSVPTIIDSGTTISRLPSAVYSSLKAELNRIISSKFPSTGGISILDTCFSGTFDQISSAVPPVELIFEGGAPVNLSPENVILEVETGTTCLSFAGNSNLRDMAIIGNQQQQTFDVVYDIASSKIGFAAGGCR